MISPTFTPEPGQFYDGVPNEVYHAAPGYSSSQLKLIADWSPRFFKESQEIERVETPAMLRGSLIHAMVLEPETVEDRYLFAPGIKKNTKAGQLEWARLEEIAASTGQTIIRDDPAELYELARSVREHKAWKALAGDDLIAERSFWWTDEDTKHSRGTGLTLKCRTDALRLDVSGGRARITDLKTCQDPRPHAFTRQVKSLGYDFSAAMYVAGVEAVLDMPCQYLWIAVRSSAPHAVAVYDAAPWLPQARETYHRTLGTLAECERTGVYPDLHGERVVALERPIWAQDTGENDE